MRFYQNQIKIIILLCNGIAKGQQNKVYIRVYVEIHLASLISSAISPNFWFQMIFSCVAIEQARSSYLFMNVQMCMGSRLCGYHLFSFCWYWHIFDMCLSFTWVLLLFCVTLDSKLKHTLEWETIYLSVVVVTLMEIPRPTVQQQQLLAERCKNCINALKFMQFT